ncbi:MAG: F0F1 ATP synthase subunit delta [Puniceicoccales bacterium]|jgi:hypothetical protein|nr:F0F1 ATP synthase subunit delta [Puniceicoccales bacterium]
MRFAAIRRANRLAPLFVDLGPAKFADGLRELQSLPAPLAKVLLPNLERELVGELRRRRAILEYAGTLAPATVAALEEKFSKNLGRRVRFVLQKNSALVGGIRITCGDWRWECSIAATFCKFLAGGSVAS